MRAFTGRIDCRPSYTMVEVMVSLFASSILVAGTASAVYIAAQASESDPVTINTIQGGLAVADLTAELRSALRFLDRGATSIDFTVVDRDGDSTPETIQYGWSGVPGAPLRRRYNGGAAVDVLEDVHDFSLTYFVLPAERVARVLMVVPDPSNVSSQDEARRSAMQAWGHSVTLIGASEPKANIDAVIPEVDVAYIPENVLSDNLGTKLTDVSIGVITEEPRLNDELGISLLCDQHYESQIVVVDNTHPITAGFPETSLRVFRTIQELSRARAPIAPDARVLARSMGSSHGVLLAVDYGGRLYNGSTAAGRRVMLPWGGVSLDFTALTNDGQKLMRQAINWAAGPFRLTRIQIVLQVGPSEYSRVVSQVDVLNQPRVPSP